MNLSFGHIDDPKKQEIISSSVLTTDHKKIFYDLYKNGHSRVIVIAHGFYNSKQAVLFKEMAELLNDEYDVIIFDFRGHGKSKGPFTWTWKEYHDLDAVIAFAKGVYDKMGVIGFSLGAATSIISASENKAIHSLIAVSPPSEFGKINFHFWKMGIMENIIYNVFGAGRVGKGVWPGWPWHKKIKPIDVIHQIMVPILLVHGKKDWLISYKHSEQLYERAKEIKSFKFLKEASHAEYIFRNDREGTIKIFKDWFSHTLAS